MNEVLSAIRLKDKIVIVSLMVVFAVLLAFGIGAVTEATVDPHVHSFEYHLERGEDGLFDFVGVCTDEECENPVSAWDITNASESVLPEIKIAATCTSDGLIKYSFTPAGETVIYTYEEKIPALSSNYSHTYVADETTVENGSASVTIKCTNKGCSDKETLDISVSDMTLASTISAATCHTPKVEIYNYEYNGATVSITASTEVEDVPHVLNGVYVTELEIAEGVFPYGTKGVTIYGYNHLSCGQRASGHYTCEVCSEQKGVYVVREDHSYEYVADATVLPTDTETGSATVKCTAEDCNKTLNITLPKIIADSNNVVSRDQDKETQVINYTYVSGDYGFVIEENITIPWPNHQFVYTESDVIRPTFDSDGSVTLRCKNSVCSEERVLTLPKMVEGYNTDAVYYHILEKKTFSYLYKNSEYGIEIAFSYEEAWIDHSYVYSESETVEPDFIEDGVAYVRCYYEGCEKYHEITIPKIVLDENTVLVSGATEQTKALHRYTYHNTDYDFTVTVDFNIGEVLTHDYKYDLKFTGISFDLVGVCNQPGCLEPEDRLENVAVVQEEHLPTCITDGYLRVTYVDERDGEEYELTMPFGFATGHVYETVSETKPTWSKEGSAVLKCSNEGCSENVTIVLPKIEYGVTAFELPTSDDGQLYYMHSKEEYGYELFFLI